MVVGVRAERDGKDFLVRAKRGVLLAAGGYDWNPELAKWFEHLPEWQSMVQPSVSGDAMMMGGEIGAAVAAVPALNLGLFFGYHVPGEEHDGKPLWRGSWEGGFPHAIWVNQAGQALRRRVVLPRLPPEDARVGRREAGAARTSRRTSSSTRTTARSTRSAPFSPCRTSRRARREGARRCASSPASSASTPTASRRTVARFNRFAEEGVDHDFGRGTYPWAAMMTGDRTRKNPNLGPLDKAPFYGLRLRVASVGINAAGLRSKICSQ